MREAIAHNRCRGAHRLSCLQFRDRKQEFAMSPLDVDQRIDRFSPFSTVYGRFPKPAGAEKSRHAKGLAAAPSKIPI